MRKFSITGILAFIALFFVPNLSAMATGTLKVMGSPGVVNPLNLTTIGTSDWRDWEAGAENASGGGQISNVITISNGVAVNGLSTINTGTPITWTNGNLPTPTTTCNVNSPNTICNDLQIAPPPPTSPTAASIPQGFSFTVLADTNIRTLYFYGSLRGTATLTATMSDGSSPVLTDSSISNTSVTYTITYSANSPGQHLTINWTTTDGASWTNGVEQRQWNYLRLDAAALVMGASPLIITSTNADLPPATQYQAYTAPALTAFGGIPPYTWSVTNSAGSLPEGMTLDPNNGIITATQVGGQGGYSLDFKVQDANGLIAYKNLTINVTADNTFGGCSIFPADSIFHHRVDFASTGLPVDNSPAGPIPAAYMGEHIRPFFGADAGPDGIPFLRVPFNQTPVNIQWLAYGGDSDPATDTPTNPTSKKYPNVVPQYPFPYNSPIEGTATDLMHGGDSHIIVLQTAGGGKSCQLYEVWQGTNVNGNIPWTASNGTQGTYAWTASNGAHWDLGSDALRPLGLTSGDAAGLPIMPLTVNYDETCPGGQSSTTSPCNGVVGHPIRFTLQHMLKAMVWPGRHVAGTGSCTYANGTATNINQLLSQANPPVSCTGTGPSGEIYRLKPNVTFNGNAIDPRIICPQSTHPQAYAIIQAMQNYGIILADNGLSGGLIGTPDARWNNNDLTCLNNISLSYFEPVNVSSLQVDPNTGATSSLAVGLTSDQASYNAPASIVLTATALEANVNINQVVINSASCSNNICGTITTSPYRITMNNIPVGTYTFTATATDANKVSITSAPVTVTVNAAVTAPSITTQPSSQTVTAPATATFSVVAVGTAPLTYQWELNDIAIPGATSSSYTTPATTNLNNGGSYSVTVTNAAGSISSKAATLTVIVPNAPKYTITAAAVSNGSITPAGVTTVMSGGTQVYTITPNTGYQIASVIVNGTALTTTPSSYTFLNITSNATISATFTQMTPSNFQRIGKVVLQPGQASLYTAAIDTVNQVAYFSTSGSAKPGWVTAVSYLAQGNPVEIGSFQLPNQDYGVLALQVDPSTGYGYYGTSTGNIGKFKLVVGGSSPTLVGFVHIADGANFLSSAIDTQNQVAYFGTIGSTIVPAMIYKMNLGVGNNLPTIAASASLNAGAYGIRNLRLDQKNGYLFALPGEVASPLPGGFVIKINVQGAIPKQVGLLTLPVGEGPFDGVAIDTDNGYLYAGEYPGGDAPNNSSKLMKIRLNDNQGDVAPTLVAALNIPGQKFLTAASIDTANGLLFLSQDETWPASNAFEFSVGQGDASPTLLATIPYVPGTGGYTPAKPGPTECTPVDCGEVYVRSGVIDPLNHIVLFGTDTHDGQVIKTTYGAAATPVMPSITRQPSSLTVMAGQSASFTVTATGTPAPSYQWQFNGVNIAQATSTTYSIAATTAAHSGTYTVVATNSVKSVASNPAILTVNPVVLAPTITTQPESQTVNLGQTASFSVVAQGSAPLTYQWYENNVAITGANGTSYITPATVASDNGSPFKVMISNSVGNVTSQVATLTVAISPIITTEPVSQTVVLGQAVKFGVVAAGSAPLSYQWERNGINIPGASSNSYSFTPTAANNNDNYIVVVSNSVGKTMSNVAILTVQASGVTKPTITITPGWTKIKVNSTLQYTVKETGFTAPVTWAVNGIAGGNAKVGTISPTGLYTAPAQKVQVEIIASAKVVLSITKTIVVKTGVYIGVD